MYVGKVTGIFRLPLALQSCQPSSARSLISRLAIATSGTVAMRSQRTAQDMGTLYKISAQKDGEELGEGLQPKTSGSKIVWSSQFSSQTTTFGGLKVLRIPCSLPSH